jgi:hypothetical protein
MPTQNGIQFAISGATSGAIARAIERGPFTCFDQLIILHSGEVRILAEDDLSVRGLVASDILLHRITGEISGEGAYDLEVLERFSI